MTKRLVQHISSILLFTLMMCSVVGLIQAPQELTKMVFSPSEATEILIIDAGHGGEDGGTSSPSGTLESHLNLSIAKRLDGFMAFCGMKTLLLRDEDISLHDADAATLREKKSSDLRNRVEMINSYENPVVISIHQNFYTGQSSHGAQVFYTGDGAGMAFAIETQELLVKHLDPFNQRVAAVTPNSVYLMNHISCPAILVECGFLSNPQEAEKLEDSGYQKKLAVVLGCAYLQREAAMLVG